MVDKVDHFFNRTYIIANEWMTTAVQILHLHYHDASSNKVIKHTGGYSGSQADSANNDLNSDAN